MSYSLSLSLLTPIFKIYVKNILLGAGETSHLGKCLLCNNEDLSSDSSTSELQKQKQVQCIYDLSAQGGDLVWIDKDGRKSGGSLAIPNIQTANLT